MAVRLIGVYDADGGLPGELRYVVGRALGRAHCALCDVTHGAVRARTEFRRCADGLGVPFDLLHRNEAGPELLVAGLPSVLARTDDGEVVPVLGPDDLEACAGDVDAFERALRDALASKGLPLHP